MLPVQNSPPAPSVLTMSHAYSVADEILLTLFLDLYLDDVLRLLELRDHIG